jgi:hypothetical protein
MSDSPERDTLPDRDANRERRLEGVKRWAEYVRANPPDVWGEQLNTIVNDQHEAARQSGISSEQHRRVEQAGEDYVTETDDGSTGSK